MAVRCFGCMKMKENRPVCEHCGYDERSSANTNQLQPGTVLGGQYVIGRVLGQGGFGITYLAWYQALNMPVAVKEYFPSSYAGRDSRSTRQVTSYDTRNADAFENNKRRFLREAQLLARMSGIPQIVRVMRYFEENGTAYIAMEYVEGMDLRRYLRWQGRPLTMNQVHQLLGPVIQALYYVHEAGLVHRDISPDNIMVLPNGTAKLLDFGAARYVENPNAEQDRNTSTQAILKHGFAPPEQYRTHGALGPWTDIYAMSATIYYCMTGKLPPESMSRMMGEAQLELHTIALNPIQRNTLERGMALQPKDRLQNAAQLYNGLFSNDPGQYDGGGNRGPDLVETDSAGKKKKLLALGAAAVAVVAALGLLLIKPKDKTQVRQPQVETEAPAALPTEGELQAQDPDAWKDNVMMMQYDFTPEDAQSWYDANKDDPDNLKGSGNSSYRVEGSRETLELSETGFYRMLGTFPVFNTDIPRGQIRQVVFLDTLKDAPEEIWDVSRKQDGSVVMWTEPVDDKLILYIAAEGGINGGTSNYRLFYGFTNLEAVYFNGCFHTDYSEDMSAMFLFCHNLEELDISTLNTDNVTQMWAMFNSCSSLTQLDVSSLNTSRVTDMTTMFSKCSGLTDLDLSNFDTSNVTDMSSMFHRCTGLTYLDLTSFSTENVTDMSGMFSGCGGLLELNLSSFRTENVTNMSRMFADCSSLHTLHLGNFTIRAYTETDDMFRNCDNLPASVRAIPNS
ncbi:MAG: BspA family leucine-rich repeat surface protein [Oscillospiraceae bacterium]|nr:BspA family leucine-rich repeat surface protein [Oscillospiraceae bacterium]